MKLTISAILLIALIAPSVAQNLENNSAVQTPPLSVWTIHSPEILVEGRSPYPVGVLTPMRTIFIKRVEALSNKGPALGTWPSGEPIPCTVQYVLELTNGSVTQTVPISNSFLNKKTSQTYTDSGPINVEFQEGARIAVSMVAPKPQFPPVSCLINGLQITIQYELAAPKKISAPQESQQ